MSNVEVACNIFIFGLNNIYYISRRHAQYKYSTIKSFSYLTRNGHYQSPLYSLCKPIFICQKCKKCQTWQNWHNYCIPITSLTAKRLPVSFDASLAYNSWDMFGFSTTWTEVGLLRTQRLTQPEFEPMTFWSWQCISCYWSWDVRSNHSAISGVLLRTPYQDWPDQDSNPRPSNHDSAFHVL